MKIYTSYFGNLRKLYSAGIVPIGISQYPPRFFSGFSMKELAPLPYMLSKSMKPETYDFLFQTKILSVLDQKAVAKKLNFLSNGKDVALCCYEKDPLECHRSAVAEWFNKAGFDVKEYGQVDKKPVPIQLDMF